MLVNKKNYKEFEPKDVSSILYTHFSSLMSSFYEMQNEFLSTRYNVHQNLEAANILLCFVARTHLEIIRERERKIDHNVSLDNFFNNLDYLKDFENVGHKIVTIVNTTGIPKETVRRNLKKLIQKEFVTQNKNRQYYWLCADRRRENFKKIMRNDIKAISKFIGNVCKFLNLNYSAKIIEEEVESQFSFYFYHFLNCQMKWFKMWQTKIKDVELIFIAMQVLIPTLQYVEKNQNIKDLGLDKIYTIAGKTSNEYPNKNIAISAASVSEITGIPRATCIRKLEKLVKLGMLSRDIKTKRYSVTQTHNRTRNLVTKENTNFTISIFSDYLSIVINALNKTRFKKSKFITS